jgi:hypothetical protein
MFDGPKLTDYKQQLKLVTLPTGTDGCRQYEQDALPKNSKYGLALILEETDNCSISKRVGFEKDAGL